MSKKITIEFSDENYEKLENFKMQLDPAGLTPMVDFIQDLIIDLVKTTDKVAINPNAAEFMKEMTQHMQKASEHLRGDSMEDFSKTLSDFMQTLKDNEEFTKNNPFSFGFNDDETETTPTPTPEQKPDPKPQVKRKS
ncbi:hypothetical protein OF377_00340 [Ureaplasma sp. ES3154-GEN]|uniref:hypothetical protein n=1 Tax=Ureaplasma sp. ES3154-GEN TaxID=2984844 RepID=UPI0021E79EE7|nr:hypothetical protein [Ureaplasma sp. ES3154-GEN]MCV3743336.1 hypothetical protein [Ureaplasma sp. ES3154-GEN]